MLRAMHPLDAPQVLNPQVQDTDHQLTSVFSRDPGVDREGKPCGNVIRHHAAHSPLCVSLTFILARFLTPLIPV